MRSAEPGSRRREQVDDRLGGEGVTVATAHQRDRARVAEDDRAVLVAHDDRLREGVERAPQSDGV